MIFNSRSTDTNNTAGGMRRRLVLNIIAFAVILYTLFFIIAICRSSFGSTHIPNEYREPANFDLTLAFIRGENPYSLEALTGEAPGTVFQYGPLFSLIVAGLHFILPFVDIFVLHYIFALICVLSAAVMATVIAYEKTETFLPSACVFLFTIACTWRYGYINAVPDTLGITLLVLIFFIETRKKIYGKEYIEATLAVILLYTKQYFIIIAVSLFIYKLMTDRKAWLKLTVSGILILTASIAIVNVTCPLYFTYTLLIVHGISGQSVASTQPLFSDIRLMRNLLNTDALKSVQYNVQYVSAENALPPTGWAFEILQLRSLAGIFFFVFLGMIAGIAKAFIQRMPRFDGSRFFVIHSAVAFAALLFLGQNDGAWLSYYLQLLMPSVVIYAFISAEKDVLDAKMARVFRWVYSALLILMVMFTTYKVDSRLSYYDKSREQLAIWDKAYKYCEAYASTGEVLYRAPLGINALSSGRYLYDNGHEMAIHQPFLDEYDSSDFYQRLFPYGGALMESHEKYREEMRRKLKQHEYSLVMTTDTDDVPGELISASEAEAAGYVKLDTLTLDMGWASYDVDFWVTTDGSKIVLEATGTV